MTTLQFPIVTIDSNKCKLCVDISIYTQEALTATLYKYTDRYYIHQQTESNVVSVIFESKEGSAINETGIKQFCNDLIDQQVRVDVNSQFGKIRDMIVEEAFKPVNK